MRLLIAAIGAFAAVLCGAASAAELVSAPELKREWLDGRSVTTVGPRGGKSIFVFRPDGTLTRSGGRTGASGVAAGGSWRIDGSGFCMTLGEGKQESCYVALRGESGAIQVLRRTGAFTWTR